MDKNGSCHVDHHLENMLDDQDLFSLSRLLHALFAAIYNQFLSLRTSPPFTCIFGHLVSFVASLNGAFFPVAFSNSNCGCFPRNFAATEALFVDLDLFFCNLDQKI